MEMVCSIAQGLFGAFMFRAKKLSLKLSTYTYYINNVLAYSITHYNLNSSIKRLNFGILYN